MGARRFQAARIFLAAFLVLLASTRPLPSTAKDIKQWSSAQCSPGHRRKLSCGSSSAVRNKGVPGTEVADTQQDLGMSVASSRATPGPSPSAQAQPAAHSTRKAQLASPVAPPTGNTAATLLLSPTSPDPRHLKSEPKFSKAHGVSMAQKTSVTPGLAQQPGGAAAFTSPASDARGPAALGALGKAVSPGTQGPHGLTSTTDMAATEPFALGTQGWSGLDAGSPALPVDSMSSRKAGTSSLRAPLAWPSSHSSSPAIPSLSRALPPSRPSPMSAAATGTGVSVDSVPMPALLAPTISASGSPPAPPHLATLQDTVPRGTTAAPSLGCTSSPPSVLPGLVSPRVPGGTNPTGYSILPQGSLNPSPPASYSSSSGPGCVTRFLSFKITPSAVPGNPVSPEPQQLEQSILCKLQVLYGVAFPSFRDVRLHGFRLASPSTLGSTVVNASLVFWGPGPSPSARDILWTLYRQVKTSGQMLGDLPVVENSLTCDRSNLSDLALETVSISFTLTSPFQPQLLQPGSASFALLEEQILLEVTPVVAKFYKAQPQEGPLLRFSDMGQGVAVHLAFKFKSTLPTRRRGLATHLAQNIVTPILQKHSIVADGEKAEWVLREVWLRIWAQPSTWALEDKTSPESQKLQERLRGWLTMVLSLLRNFDQVVVEDLCLDPLTAKLGATFFGEAPSQALVQALAHWNLPTLQAAKDLSAQVVFPGPGSPCTETPALPGTSIPSYAVALLALGLLLATLSLVLMLKSWLCPGVLGCRGRKCHCP